MILFAKGPSGFEQTGIVETQYGYFDEPEANVKSQPKPKRMRASRPAKLAVWAVDNEKFAPANAS